MALERLFQDSGVLSSSSHSTAHTMCSGSHFFLDVDAFVGLGLLPPMLLLASCNARMSVAAAFSCCVFRSPSSAASQWMAVFGSDPSFRTFAFSSVWGLSGSCGSVTQMMLVMPTSELHSASIALCVRDVTEEEGKREIVQALLGTEGPA